MDNASLAAGPCARSYHAIALSADGSRCVGITDGTVALAGRVLACDAVALAVLDAALWVVVRDGGGHALWWFDDHGDRVAALPLGELGDAVEISAARRGARVALIEGKRAVEVRERDGALCVRELDAPGRDRRVLLAGRGVFERRGGALVPSAGGLSGYPIAQDLQSARVVSGAVVLDGAMVVIEVEHRGIRHLLVQDARRGATLTRIRIGAAAVTAVAERSGIVVLGHDRCLALLDVRTGRCHRERRFAAAIRRVAISEMADRVVAIDELGQILELRAGLSDAGATSAAAPDLGDGTALVLAPSTGAGESARQHASPVDAGAGAPPEADRGEPAGSCRAPAVADAADGSERTPDEAGGRGAGEVDRRADGEASSDRAHDGPDGVQRGGAGPRADGEADGRGDARVEAAPPLLALEPRPVGAALPAEALRAMLDDLFELVSAWCHTAAVMAQRGTDEEGEALAREREAAAAARVGSRDAPAPLAELIREFGLSSLAGAILLVAAAPRLWGELARTYAALAGDAGRALVDELLICQILEIGRADRGDVARELEDGSPLVRHGLLALGRGARPFAALEVPHAAVRRLAGERFAAGEGMGGVASRVADRALDELAVPRERVAALVGELARRPVHGPVRVVVRGRAGCGRRTLAAALAGLAGRVLGLVEVVAASDEEAVAALRRDLREAHLRGWLACVSGIDHVAGDTARRERLRAVLDAHPGPLFVRCEPDAIAPLAPGHLAIDLPPLTLAERGAVWRDAFARHRLAADGADELAERYAVGAGTAHRIAAEVAATDGAGSAAARIDRALRQRRAERLGRLASRVEQRAAWADLVLPDDMLDSVRELIARVRLRSTVLDGWGMSRIATTGRAITALFQGGPGTGKTLVAGVVARELGYDLYRVDLARVTSKWVGETEKNLAELFDAADDGQCILLFDEADALFGKRTEVKSSHDRHANLEVNYLLQRLDSFEGIAILTTNFGTAIDPAFRRRLSLHLQFPFPEETERERLWRVHLPATLPVAGDLDLTALARKYQLSGGYIRNAALRAAYLAAGERTAVTADHLRRAVTAEYRDKAKISTAGTLE